MMRLVCIDNDVQTDITAYTGNYSRSDNIDSLGMEFTFDLMSNPLDDQFTDLEIGIGAKVVFSNNGKNVFTGIVTRYSRNGLNTWKYTCYDFAFYLNKSEAMIQFNNVSVSTALKRLCSENEIPIGEICEINTTVKKIYNGDKISDIIKDLLKMSTFESGTKYRLEVRDNLLYIQKYEDLILSASYKPAKNVPAFDATKVVGSYSNEESIEDMANRILVVSSSEKHAQVYANVQDGNNIKRFGLLTRVERIEDKKKSQALQIAKTKLNDLNRIKKTFKVTLFGDDQIRSGRMLVFDQNEIYLKGTYLVKNCTHNYNARTHTMVLELGEK